LELFTTAVILAKLFPWFPIAGKASDLIVILLAGGAVLIVALLLANNRRNGGPEN
jgi:hypothetical protein